MINLLPPDIKQELLIEKNKKIVVILGILVLVFLLCLILALLSIKFYTQGQVNYYRAVYEIKESQFKNSQAQEIQKQIIGLNQDFLEIDSFYQKQVNLIEVLEKIAQVLPQGVYLNSFSYEKLYPVAEKDKKDKEKESFSGRISISGYAPTRDVLFEFKKNLEAEDDFKEFVFPASNWVKATDINFSLGFKIINYGSEQK